MLKEEEKLCRTVKSIYGCLLESKVKRGESFIPSRAEKKNSRIKFGNVWKNQVLISNVSPELRYFAWSLGQDMVVVGARRNRRNQRKECQEMIEEEGSGQMMACGALETLTHALATCPASKEKFAWIKNIIEDQMEDDIGDEQIVFLSLRCRNEKKNKTILWVLVNCLHFIWANREATVESLKAHLKKEMFFHQMLERWVGDRTTFGNIWEFLQQ